MHLFKLLRISINLNIKYAHELSVDIQAIFGLLKLKPIGFIDDK